MLKKLFLILGATLSLSACLQNGQSVNSVSEGLGGLMHGALSAYSGTGESAALSDAQIAAGLKEALGVGTGNVVTRLGVIDGFNRDTRIHIPLPSQLQKMDETLQLVGMNSLTQDLETRMNRAAELATPKAKQLFVNAIGQMTFADARTILFSGQPDAATQFFRRTMGAKLITDIQPIVQTTLADAGAMKAFDSATNRYNTLPMVGNIAGDAKNNLHSYVANKAVDGIFYYVAQEEAAIRANPAKRTTDLLRKVFGAL